MFIKNNDEKQQMNIKISPYTIIVWAMTSAYIVYWSYLSIYRIITFRAGTYDLGVISQELYLSIGHLTFYGYFTAFLNRDIAIILSPLTLFHSLYAIVIVQSIFLGLPGLLIYCISNRVTNDRRVSIIFAFVYFVYPPLYGVNCFDVHN